MAEHNKQIENMIGFITAEAREKATELEQEAQETYTIEKQRMIEAEKKKIKTEFERKEKQVQVQKRIRQSNQQKEQRLRVLKTREECLQAMMKDAKDKLVAFTKDQGQYKKTLSAIIAQSVCELGVTEKPLEVLGLARDSGILAGCLSEAMGTIKQHLKADLTITISKTQLPEDDIGGVVVQTLDGNIKSINTFKAREATVATELLPRFRSLLFA
eukprot:NODE_2280_length_806_cov_248.054161_g1593_i0.p2 GENE.NODE_2280_length_806_cov_248.054161_g1593_i0~~NODE_2280_length_806_cov_248.054161_g1593_i0.p2  ORF type:complete len:215 (+),score=114.05 NODE_2280_length_806_cov_248.054161_g1593_i0:72-716(+)